MPTIDNHGNESSTFDHLGRLPSLTAVLKAQITTVNRVVVSPAYSQYRAIARQGEKITAEADRLYMLARIAAAEHSPDPDYTEAELRANDPARYIPHDYRPNATDCPACAPIAYERTDLRPCSSCTPGAPKPTDPRTETVCARCENESRAAERTV